MADAKQVNDNFFDIRHINGTKGKGVIANNTIKNGTIIDVGHVILICDEEYDEHIKNTIVDDYVFEWDDGKVAICMSPCEFCNHSYNPNASYEHRFDDQTIIFRAIRDIKKGEEITVNYNGNIDDLSPVWFTVEEATEI
ncbi:MAG TPA: SET domain-containing protein-lysine N-methyltransferase [Candidatus Lokiarchaeia archaeon]|nr:SET domain-containing protein-lysine N-methyltransferase [Candidatus Lokiarchaeia archaeon]